MEITIVWVVRGSVVGVQCVLGGATAAPLIPGPRSRGLEYREGYIGL